MSLQYVPPAEKRTKLFVGIGALVFALLIAGGVFARNGWFPSGPDPFTGKRTGWFGRPLPKNASSSWNPLAPPLPTPTPQLAREYVYASGSRLLSVVDSNAQEVPPADLAIWRPGTGTWWVMSNGQSQQVSQQWGVSTDKPVPGDYDGDGKTDFSVFRPSTSEWYILNSSDSTWIVWQWGLTSDIRVPADYDGDGKTDRAIYRPSNSDWYIILSSNGSWYQPHYGQSGDIAAPADYDGDGRADVAVFRPGSPGTFYVLKSGNGQTQTAQLGQTGDLPVSADYDGDGKADYALRRGVDWIFLYSANNQTATIPWQQATDVAVQNDYDGDGKVDIATWRDSNGNWYIRQSSLVGQSGELRQVQWGMSADIPMPAFYRR